MIELERHIEILLLSNDCVIVPDLGGFVAHHVDAHYDEEDHLFLPPLRSLGFNPQLKTLNDHLLAQSYIEVYDVSYPEAIRRIEDEVNELKQRLANEGFYELNDIGTLRMNEDGKYVFEPCEAGILTPTLYGLSSFEYKALQMENVTGKANGMANGMANGTMSDEITEEVTEEQRTDKRNYTTKQETVAATDQKQGQTTADAAETARLVHIDSPANNHADDHANGFTNDHADGLTIKYSWLRNIVATAAAIVCFFLFTSPIYNSEQSNLASMAHISNASIIPSETSSKAVDTKVKPVIRKVDAAALKAKQDSILRAAEVAKTPKHYYCLVLASQVTKENAERFAQQMRDKGFDQTQVYVNNRVVRVIYGKYTTEAEAFQKMKHIRHLSEFSDTWVYEVNH